MEIIEVEHNHSTSGSSSSPQCHNEMPDIDVAVPEASEDIKLVFQMFTTVATV